MEVVYELLGKGAQGAAILAVLLLAFFFLKEFFGSLKDGYVDGKKLGGMNHGLLVVVLRIILICSLFYLIFSQSLPFYNRLILMIILFILSLLWIRNIDKLKKESLE